MKIVLCRTRVVCSGKSKTHKNYRLTFFSHYLQFLRYKFITELEFLFLNYPNEQTLSPDDYTLPKHNVGI